MLGAQGSPPLPHRLGLPGQDDLVYLYPPPTNLLMAITLWPPDELNRTFVSCSFFTISSSVRGLRGLRPREPILIITLYVSMCPPACTDTVISGTKYILSLCAVPGCCPCLDLETTFLFLSFVLNTEADTRQDTAPCRPRTPQAFLASCVLYTFACL